MTNAFNMCPMCGSKNIENPGLRKWICRDCGFDLYNNVAAAVGIIIYDKDKNVLFEVRAKEPKKDLLHFLVVLLILMKVQNQPLFVNAEKKLVLILMKKL